MNYGMYGEKNGNKPEIFTKNKKKKSNKEN
jgi:hypothetical protein